MQSNALRLLLFTWGLLWSLSPASRALAEQLQSAATVQQRPANEVAGVVNLNTASAEELERLPGIGPTRARAILDLRTRITRFTRVEDLLRVKGIGRASFRKLKPWLAVAGPTTLQHAPAKSR